MTFMDKYGFSVPAIEDRSPLQGGSIFRIDANKAMSAHIAKLAQRDGVRPEIWTQRFFDACYAQRFGKDAPQLAVVPSPAVPAPDCDNCAKLNMLRSEKAELERKAKEAVLVEAASGALNKAMRQVAELKADLSRALNDKTMAENKIAALGLGIKQFRRDAENLSLGSQALQRELEKAVSKADDAEASAERIGKEREELRVENRTLRASLRNAHNAQKRLADELTVERNRRAHAERELALATAPDVLPKMTFGGRGV